MLHLQRKGKLSLSAKDVCDFSFFLGGGGFWRDEFVRFLQVGSFNCFWRLQVSYRGGILPHQVSVSLLVITSAKKQIVL